MIGCSFFSTSTLADVRIWEEELTIPTYEVLEPDPVPRFYEGRVYQGAQGRIYPYPISDRLTDELKDKTYNAVYLENEYIKICVLPQIGGRIFTAVDKTNGYDFFYRQSVIKPALIGMLGAWISGGVEWNFPHHHRSRTFMEMDRTLVENPDGSKTLWLGELERRHRMRFVIGLTLYPGRSYLEGTFKIVNRTPYVNSFLYFANPAVHVDETYQVIFPPETEYVTQHAKREFSEWPISNSHYGGHKYDNTDISWWKNLSHSVSFFCWNYESDFFAGYNHGKEAGVAYIGDHNTAPGKKFFTFGCGDSGKMWDKMLTDTDGPYLELMAGAYSDNQPDYSWVQPYETKIVKQYWYPIRDLSGLKYANLEGAVNLEVVDGKTARIKLNATSERKDARIVLKQGDIILIETTADIGPAKPWHADAASLEKIEETNLTLWVYSSDGKELIRYQPKPRPGNPMPKPVVPPAKPEEIKTNEELYLAGLRLDQFHNAQVDPYPYYEEALKRDPGDSRVNTQLGILSCKRGMFAEAETHLQTAVDRLFDNYTRPKDGEAYYYLGLAQAARDKLGLAYDAFFRASWSLGWRSASYYALAELDCRAGDYQTALEHIDASIETNTLNPKAYNLKAAILRKLNRLEESLNTTELALAIDPLDFWSRNERALAWIDLGQKDKAQGEREFIQSTLKDLIQGNLEMAVDYGNAGFYNEAIDILARTQTTDGQPGEAIPMVFYYLAYYHDRNGDGEAAEKFRQQAARANADYCFPLRLECIPVLQQAIDRNPNDAMAPYYLGNFLFDRQPEAARRLWQQAAESGCPYYMNYRNLGYASARVDNDVPQAVAYYEKAQKLNPKDARIYFELDRLYARQGKLAKDRLALMEKNQKTVAQRDDALQREIELFVEAGKYDRAIQLLTGHHFHTWEGGGDIHGVYANAYLLRGLTRMKGKKYDLALSDFEASLLYPDNLEVARPADDPNAVRAYFLIGLVYEKKGNQAKAQEYYKQSSEGTAYLPEMEYYKAQACRKIGEDGKAASLFDRLIERGERMVQREESGDFFAKFGERQTPEIRQAIGHYTSGLGWLGKGDKEKARDQFKKAIELNPNYAWAKMHLDEIK